MNVNKKPNQKPKVVPIRQRWWHSPFFRTLVHVATTSATAVFIGLAALGLDLFASLLEAQKTSAFVVSCFHVFANTIMVIDCVWFVGNLIRGIYNEWFR